MTSQALGHRRRLALAGTYNVRDIGGYPTHDGRITRWGTIIRADSLHRLDPSAQQELADLGVKTVIDLRGAGEVQDAPSVFADSATVSYRNLALLGDPTVSSEPSSPRPLAVSYRDILQVRRETLGAIVQHLAAANGLPAVVHCTAGKDRTGIVIALLLGVAGVPNETIAQDYELSATYLVGDYFDEARQRAEKAGIPWERYRERLICPASIMLETLGWLEGQYGGARSYLIGAGVAPGLLEDLRDRLLE